jgi:Pyridoxamine 5'-phosphate oxidase
MSQPLDTVAPAFIAMAHRIVWCTVATVDGEGRPHTRILHPIWQFDGGALTGWIATSPRSPKARDLAVQPEISLTYWDATHDTCTADCATSWDESAAERAEGWRRFAEGPAPVGYDPSIIPQWTDPTAPEFGILRLSPHRLRVMPGSLMLAGQGDLLTWRQG